MITLSSSPAPAPAAAPTPPGGVRRFYSILRDVREEVVRLRQLVVEAARTGGAGPLVTPILATAMSRETPEVDRRLAQAATLIDDHEDLADHWSDALTRIVNRWEDAKSAWVTVENGQMTTDALMNRLDAMIVDLGMVTVPPRAAENLSRLRVGGAMDFHGEFADEIPMESARTRILAWINQHPLSVPGVVNLAAGTIIAASPSRFRRVLSWLGILLVMALGFLAAATTSRWLDVVGIGKTPAGAADHSYVLATAAAYAGAIFHVLVSALKQYRTATAGSDQSFTALGNFGLWVHVHEGYLMVYALMIPIAAYTLILTTGAIDLVTVFLVGYSIDSVLDVLLARFDDAARKRTEVVTEIVGKPA